MPALLPLLAAGAAALLLLGAGDKKNGVRLAPSSADCLPKAAKSLAEMLEDMPDSEREKAAQVLTSKGQVNIAKALSDDAPRSELEAAIVKDLKVASPARLREVSDTIGQFRNDSGAASSFNAAAVWNDVVKGDFSSTDPVMQAEYDAHSRRAALAIQRGLNDLGLGPLDVDGVWAGETRAAWKAFMDEQGLQLFPGDVQEPGVIRMGELLGRPPIKGAGFASDCLLALAIEKEAA